MTPPPRRFRLLVAGLALVTPSCLLDGNRAPAPKEGFSCVNHLPEPDDEDPGEWTFKCYYHYFDSRVEAQARHAQMLFETLGKPDHGRMVAPLIDGESGFFVSVWTGSAGGPTRPLAPDDKGKPLSLRIAPRAAHATPAGGRPDLLGRTGSGGAAASGWSAFRAADRAG